MTSDEIIEKIQDCKDVMDVCNTSVSKWEHDFIESIEEQIITKGTLSEKQEQILNNIWEKI